MGQRSRISRNNTAIERGVGTDGFTRVILHSTAVVTFNETEIILNSGGWRTATTSARMAQASAQFGLGFGQFQRDGAWYVEFRGKVYPFEDGMSLDRTVGGAVVDGDELAALSPDQPKRIGMAHLAH